MYISPKRYLMKLENIVFGHNPKRIKNSNCSWITDLRQYMTSWGTKLFSFFKISLEVEVPAAVTVDACLEIAFLTFNLVQKNIKG